VLSWLGVKRKRRHAMPQSIDPLAFLAPEDRPRIITQKEWHKLSNIANEGALAAALYVKLSDKLDRHMEEDIDAHERLARLEAKLESRRRL